jgi:hypothetical protein
MGIARLLLEARLHRTCVSARMMIDREAAHHRARNGDQRRLDPSGRGERREVVADVGERQAARM